MHSKGVYFLDLSFEKIYNQTYKDVEIVISDHSIDDSIKDMCEKWKSKLNIKYIRNENNRGSSSANTNNAINYCTSEYIKILFQDDYLFDNNSLQNIITILNEKNPIWLATSCEHSDDGINCYNRFVPEWNDRIWTGSNSLSSPSVITVRRDSFIEFDNDLIWMMDCDWYKRMFDKYGKPYILDEICIVNRTWGGRLSDTISYDRKNNEKTLMFKKYS